ncbi:hypothetical protein [Natrinema sp. 74]|uniref:hypothetical protein n=1 Tax=Natrinema sp. 74 TaxID=3384159 RepID=UPI0038D38B7B
MSEDIDIRSEVDRAGRRFIAAIEYYGGEATMTEIRQRTGMDWDVADWRFRKFEDYGLIEVSYADHGRGDRDPPRVAKLTGKARAEVERGLLYDIDQARDSEEIHDLVAEVRAIREDINRLENKVDAAVDTLHTVEAQVNDLNGDLDWMMGEWADGVESSLFGIRDALEAEDIGVTEAIRARCD